MKGRPSWPFCEICGKQYSRHSMPIHQKRCRELMNKQIPDHIKKRILAQNTRKSSGRKGEKRIKGKRRKNKKNLEDEFSKVPISYVSCKYCQRNFSYDRIVKHESVCIERKGKRRKFLSKKQRMDPLMKSHARTSLKTSKTNSLGSKFKKSNWREQHKEFIKMLKENRKYSKNESNFNSKQHINYGRDVGRNRYNKTSKIGIKNRMINSRSFRPSYKSNKNIYSTNQIRGLHQKKILNNNRLSSKKKQSRELKQKRINNSLNKIKKKGRNVVWRERNSKKIYEQRKIPKKVNFVVKNKDRNKEIKKTRKIKIIPPKRFNVESLISKSQTISFSKRPSRRNNSSKVGNQRNFNRTSFAGGGIEFSNYTSNENPLLSSSLKNCVNRFRSAPKSRNSNWRRNTSIPANKKRGRRRFPTERSFVF